MSFVKCNSCKSTHCHTNVYQLWLLCFSAVFCGQDRTLSSVQTHAHATMGPLLWTHKSHWKPLSCIPEKAQVMTESAFCMSMTLSNFKSPHASFGCCWRNTLYLFVLYEGFFMACQSSCLPWVSVMYIEYDGHWKLFFFSTALAVKAKLSLKACHLSRAK